MRGDTGYNNTELIEILEEEGVSDVFGYNVQGKTMKKGLFAHIAEMYAAAPGSSISMSQEILAKLPATGLFAEVNPPKRRRKLTSTTAGGKLGAAAFTIIIRAKNGRSLGRLRIVFNTAPTTRMWMPASFRRISPLTTFWISRKAAAFENIAYCPLKALSRTR